MCDLNKDGQKWHLLRLSSVVGFQTNDDVGAASVILTCESVCGTKDMQR